MKNYHLNYYPEFKCIAKKCKHTCCAGWEMLIDKESLDKYQSDLSPFAKTLKNGINFKKSKFKHDKHKRCTFLNQSGLCDLIINLGEESLCQVCRDHPRFRSFFSDRVEMGLGFSCEQATKIILSFKDKIELVQTSDNFANEQLSFIEQHVLSFREKALSIIQDRTSDINDRIKKLLTFCNTEFSTKDFNKILRCFIGFEKLDKSWNKRLNALKKYSFDINTEQNLSFYCEQFLVNSIYNKGKKHEEYKKIIIDSNNYKEKREDTLKILAERMAAKAVRENRDIRLEPMNANERRLIHSALSDNTKVETISQGNEPNRFVTIKLINKNNCL